MKSFRTHYDNLKVSRDAPDVVIRAAYKSLSQRFHPDKNLDDERAAQIMVILNRSYEVLCDPVRRREHDEWIEKVERELAQETSVGVHVRAPRRQTVPNQAKNTTVRFLGPVFAFFKGIVIWLVSVSIGLGAFLGVMALIIFAFEKFGGKPNSPSGPKPYSAAPTKPSRPAYTRPANAPNGELWPTSAGYVRGYQVLAAGGLSEITVDNRQNDSDVFVKLVSLDGSEAFPVRQFFIPARSQFTLRRVDAGNYDIRYRDLDSGGLSRSESFNIEQIATEDGVRYSTMTLTLYKVRDGNFQTYTLSEAEF